MEDKQIVAELAHALEETAHPQAKNAHPTDLSLNGKVGVK